MIGVVDGVDIGSDMYCEVLIVDVHELNDAADETKTHVVVMMMMSVTATMCSKAGDIVVVSDLPRMQPLKVIVAVRLHSALLFVVGMASSWSSWSRYSIRYVMCKCNGYVAAAAQRQAAVFLWRWKWIFLLGEKLVAPLITHYWMT